MENISPPGALERARKFYETNADEYTVSNANMMHEHLTDFIRNLASRARVLDAGCGPGRDLERLSSWGMTPVGADFTLAFCATAAAFAPVVCADLRNLPFSDACFDAVWACASLIHLDVSDTTLALAELHRVSRVGALCEFWVKAEATSAYAGAGADERWFQTWKPDGFTTVLEAAGFTVRFCRVEGRFLGARAISR